MKQMPHGLDTNMDQDAWGWWQSGVPPNSGEADQASVNNGSLSGQIWVDGQLSKLAGTTGLLNPTVYGAQRWCQSATSPNITYDQGAAPSWRRHVLVVVHQEPLLGRCGEACGQTS